MGIVPILIGSLMPLSLDKALEALYLAFEDGGVVV